MRRYLNKRKRILVLGDFLLMIAANIISVALIYGLKPPDEGFNKIISIIVIFLFLMNLYICHLYDINKYISHKKYIFSRVLMATFFTVIMCSVLFYIIRGWELNRKIFLLNILISFCFIISWRFIYQAIFSSLTVPKEKVLIVGAGKCGRAIYKLLQDPISPFVVEGFVDDDPDKKSTIQSAKVLGFTNKLIDIANKLSIKTIIFAITHDRSSKLMNNILQARLSGLRIYEMPKVYELLSGRMPVQYIRDQWLLFDGGFFDFSESYFQRIKRVIDIIFSAISLLMTLPITLAVALAIRLDSPGPIFYRQERVGYEGEVFSILKFRTMYQNAEKNGAVWAQENDPRVTRVGKWIRLFRVDEIPQLWNIMRGEMSLIGPRPERPEFVAEFQKIIPYYFIRHLIKPGLSGWAQVNYRYGASIDDTIIKLEYDFFYLKNFSLWLDLKIIIRTIGTVFFMQGGR
jgi:exopolysaccharide biosynthesis polyprenyl glycosylphosphotransferase